MNTEGIILAAGHSSRMGVSKLELPFGDKTVIVQTVCSLLPFSSKIILVCGKQVDSLQKLMRPYPKVQTIYNENFEQGMFTSVQKGVASITGDSFFLLPGDHPLIARSTFTALLSAAEKYQDRAVFVPRCEQHKGHPILLRKSIINTILKAPKDTTLRHVLVSQKPIFVDVNDEGILRDIDTREDYEVVAGLRDLT